MAATIQRHPIDAVRRQQRAAIAFVQARGGEKGARRCDAFEQRLGRRGNAPLGPHLFQDHALRRGRQACKNVLQKIHFGCSPASVRRHHLRPAVV